MTSELLHAVEKLRLSRSEEGIGEDDCIDDVDELDQQRPKKRTKQDHEALKTDLEAKFLSPPTAFRPEWLNKLQQYVTMERAIEIGSRIL